MSRNLIVPLALVLALGSPMANPQHASAQDMRTLQIRDGVVQIDGKEVPQSRLPETLKTGDVQLFFSWTGDSEPVIEIGERFYTVDDKGLREVDARVYPSARQRYFDALGAVGEGTWYSTGADDETTRKQVEALNVQAREMVALSEALDRERVEDREQLASELRKQAEMTRQMAVEIPRMNVATYWDAVREADEELYNRLVDEYHLESRIQALAAQVRALTDKSRRTEAVTELRELLDRAFELKQQNRRQEIDQLENELETMQVRLKEREALRERIIERRLQELIGRN